MTRMPVKLELSPADHQDFRVVDQGRETRVRNSAELLANIARTMTALGDTIVDRELIVKIAQPGLPRLTLIDLPGIREVTEREASRRLTSKYVNDPNTVVLCVIPATKILQVRPSLCLPLCLSCSHTSAFACGCQTDQALGLVKELHAGDRTLLVLTMCDLVVDKQWDTRIIKPLLGENDALMQCGLRGCFGVVNRSLDESTGTDSESLADAGSREEIFLEGVLARVRGSRPEETWKRVVSRLSMGNLTLEVDAVFHERKFECVARWFVLDSSLCGPRPVLQILSTYGSLAR